jgi:hypothetical protein
LPTCDSPITAEKHKKDNSNLRYYRCTKKKRDVDCEQRYVREEDLQFQVSQTITGLTLNDDWSGLIIEALESKLDRLLELHLDNSIFARDFGGLCINL